MRTRTLIPLLLVALALPLVAQFPNPGPGLGNLTYSAAERYRRISMIREGPDHPVVPPGAPKPHYGMNIGAMSNGYFVTVLAYDSGHIGGGLLFYDLSDPRNIVQVNQIYEPEGRTADMREVHSMCFANIDDSKYMVIQSHKGIHVWDLADVNNPVLTGKLDFTLAGNDFPISGGDYSNAPWQIAYQHPYAYVSGTNLGIFVVDLSDPANPVLADRGQGNPNPIPISELGGFAVGPIFLMGNRMLISSMNNVSGFTQLDLSSPLHPIITSTMPSAPQFYYSIAYDGNYFYTAPPFDGGRMEVFDVSDPGVIEKISEGPQFSGTNFYNARQDHYSFQGASTGTYKMDVSDPENPVQVAFIPAPSGTDEPDQSTLLGNLLFMGADHGPQSPFVVHQIEPDTSAPTVTAMSPADGATGVATSSRIGLSFSDNIDLETVSTSTIEVRPLIGGAIPGEVVSGVYTASLGFINFTPDEPLLPSTPYTVTLPEGGVEDWAGNGTPAFSATFTTGGPGTTPGGTGPTEGLRLVHHWPLNSGFDDAVGGNHGTPVGNAVIDGGSLLLDGSGDYMDLAADLLPVLGDTSTLAFMIQTSDVGANDFWQSPGVTGIEEFGAGNDIHWGYLTNTGRIGLKPSDGAAVVSSAPINDGAWHQVVFTRNASTGRIQVFIDGVLDGAVNSFVGTPTLGFDKIGRILDTGGSPEDLAARLRDVRVYEGEMSAADVDRLFLEIGMTHHWPLLSDAEDIVTTEDGTLLNGAAISGQCLDLDGVDDHLALPQPHSGELASIDGSLSFFIQTTQSGNDAPWLAPGVMGSDQNLGTNDVFLGYLDAAGRIGIRAGDGASAVSTTAVNDGEWHHVVLTRDVSSGALEVHVDGVLEGAVTGEAGAKTQPIDSIGRIEFNGSASYLDGCLRDLRVYRSVLTAQQISTLRNELSLEVSPPGPAVVGGTVNFTATSSGFGTITYDWNFGDGTSLNDTADSSVSHAYAAPGHYQVTVTASNGAATLGESFLQTIHRPLTSSSPARSSTIVHSAGTVFVVNSDNDTLSSVDGADGSVNWEVPTGDHPRTVAVAPDGRVWVANLEGGSVTVHNPSTGAVESTIPFHPASRPFGLAFAPDGSAAFVTLEATGEVCRISPVGVVEQTAAAGPWPRGLAISADSSRLFVTRFISPDSGAEIREFDAGTLAPVRTFVLPVDTTTVDSSTGSRGLPNYLGSITISPDGATALVPSKKDNILRGDFIDGNPLTFETSVRSVVSSIDLAGNVTTGTQFKDLDDRGMPSAVQFTPLGDYAFVTTEGTNTVEILDAYTGARIGNIFVTGLTPRSLALNDDGSLLHVHDFMTRTLETYDISDLRDGVDFNPSLVSTASLVGDEILPADVLLGKQLFYNASDGRMTRDGYLSCAACHDDGGHDGRVWDFTDRGEGLRNTTDLRGRGGAGHGPVHWSGNFDEIQDFEHDIRNSFGGTGFLSNAEFNSGTRNTPLGDPKAGVDELLDALAAYVTSLDTVPPSPHRKLDGSLTDSALRGREVFISLDCASCHSGAPFTDSSLGLFHDVGTIQASSGQRLGQPLTGLDTPTLKGVWSGAPYLHDGSAATLMDVLTTRNPSDQHGPTSTLSGDQLDDLVAYLQEFGEASAPADEFDLWRHAQFTLEETMTPGITGLEDNPDGDGLINAMEFLHASSPSIPGATPKILHRDPEGGMMLSFDVDPVAAAFLRMSVEGSGDLSEWTKIPDESFEVVPQGAMDRYQMNWVPGDGSHFFRFRLEP